MGNAYQYIGKLLQYEELMSYNRTLHLKLFLRQATFKWYK